MNNCSLKFDSEEYFKMLARQAALLDSNIIQISLCLEHTFKIKMIPADHLFSDKRKSKRLNMVSMIQYGKKERIFNDDLLIDTL